MLKNITFSAEEKLIESARKKARNNNTTINTVFRQWLSVYAKEQGLISELDNYLDKTAYVNSGRSFTRDEYNQR